MSASLPDSRVLRPPLASMISKAVLLSALLCIETGTPRLHAAPPADQPKISEFKLPNGIRVIVLEFAGSRNASIFSFLPMGLAHDDAGSAQWAHLVEHLVIRSTVPFGSQQANAETLPDHMRLDFYGTADNWQEALSHHARWLKGVPFTEATLIAEKPNALSECDFVAANLATHKFAMAAWSQAFRHGKAHAAVKGDLNRATLAQIQQYRDERLAVLDKLVVCIVGGVSANAAEPVVRAQLGTITPAAKAIARTQLFPGKHEMTWDLDARHIVLTWPIPSPEKPDHAALELAAHCLTMQCYQDSELQGLVGMIVGGADLSLPEGSFLYVSASLRPGTKFEDVQTRIESHLDKLRTNQASLFQVPALGFQLSQALTTVPDPATLQAQIPAGVDPKLIEAQLGLIWGMHAFRYAAERTKLAKQLTSVNASQVQTAVKKYLASNHCTVCTVRPGEATR